MPESRSILHWGGPPCGRIHRGGRPLFAATPRNREWVEQSNAGHYTRAGSGRSDLQGLSIDCCSYANPAPVAVGLRFSCMFNRGHSRSILDCASHDSRDNRDSTLLHCAYGLPVRFSAIPAWIDRGSGSCPCRVQSVTLPQLLVRDFALNGTFLAVRDFGKFRESLPPGQFGAGTRRRSAAVMACPSCFSPLLDGDGVASPRNLPVAWQ